MKNRNCLVFLLIVSVGLLPGCQQATKQNYDLKGKVVSVDKAQRQVTIAHETIPGFMDAMTMPFNVRDDWAMSVLAPGQTVEATLVIQGDRSWIEGLRINKKEPVADSVFSTPGPKLGEEVPDFWLVNQDNRRIHLRQFLGRPLLLTFIYTRCPLPDYCPRTSKSFSEIYRGLQSRPPSDRDLHLLTVSFDTENDTPSILREYASRYMNPVNFKQWEFASGSADQIKKITGYFGLSYRPESGQITHNLITVLIGADGKVARLYPGNQWRSADIFADLQK